MAFSGLREIFSNFTARHITSFRQKIFLIAVLMLVITSMVYTFEAVRTEQAIMHEELRKKAKVVAELAAQIGELPLISGNTEQMKKTVSSLEKVPEVSFVVFYDSAMNLLFKKTNIVPPPEIDPGHFKMSLFERNDYFDLYSPVLTTRESEDIDFYQESYQSINVKESVGWIRIGFSKTYMKQAKNSIIYRGLIIAIVIIIGSSIVLFKLTTTATRPLTVLSNAAKSLRKGIYTEIDIPNSTDEIGTLTAEFKRMSSTIKEREEMLVSKAHLSAFVAQISIILTQSEELKVLLKYCTDIMSRHFNASLARIWIYKKEFKTLELLACAGLYSLADNPQKSVPVGEFEVGSAAINHMSYYSNDIENLHALDIEWAKPGGIKSFAIYPLIVENQLVGVLEMFTENTITEDVFNTIDSVADSIALGIKHKLAEQQIKASLSEKEVLLREVHHRVKNNMQVISSLLSLQSGQIKDREYADKFNDSRNRIRSMALVHEKLYQSKDMANIDFNDYVKTLANSLFSFYEILSRTISLEIDVEDIVLGVDTAIPCGLIINELLSNCLKHAFSNGKDGSITISFKKDKIEGKTSYELIISDNGVGIAESIDIKNTESLGLQLIMTLVEHQLQGRLNLIRTGGTKFIINFREINYKKRL